MLKAVICYHLKPLSVNFLLGISEIVNMYVGVQYAFSVGFVTTIFKLWMSII